MSGNFTVITLIFAFISLQHVRVAYEILVMLQKYLRVERMVSQTDLNLHIQVLKDIRGFSRMQDCFFGACHCPVDAACLAPS